MEYTKQEKLKDKRLQKEYNITLEERNKVEEFQKHCCAICKKSHNLKGEKLTLYVDHCHKSGLDRGLLCYMCNKGIAIFRDNPEKLKNAFEYFQNNPFTTVLGEPRLCVPGRIGTKKRAKIMKKLARENNDNSDNEIREI